MSKRRWDLESVEAEARKYTKVVDFKYGSRGAYDWAERNGLVKQVTAFMADITDPAELMTRIRQELGTAARHAKVAHDICENVSDFYVPKEHDPEAVSAGTYLDFEAQMYDQAAEERSDRALDHIEALRKHGTPEQIAEAWDLYLKYQTKQWEVPKSATGIIEINMPETEHGGSYDY
jgi:hypothetical protein